MPLFLRDDQTLVDAAELKADLAKLDAHYSGLPKEVKETGFHGFATDPPDSADFRTTRLWDKHLPRWREGFQTRSIPAFPRRAFPISKTV